METSNNCTKCGAGLKQNAAFCVKCGTKITRQIENPPPVSQAAGSVLIAAPDYAQGQPREAPPAVYEATGNNGPKADKRYRLPIRVLRVAVPVLLALAVVFGLKAIVSNFTRPTNYSPSLNYFKANSGFKISKINWSYQTIHNSTSDPITMSFYQGKLYVGTETSVLYGGTDEGFVHEFIKRPSPKVFLVTGDVMFVVLYGRIAAIDMKSKKELWAFKSKNAIEKRPVAYNNTLFISSTGSAGIIAIDTTSGKELWSIEADLRGYSELCFSGDTIFFGNRPISKGKHDDTFELRAVNAKNGRKRWSFRSDGILSVSPAFAQNTVFFGSEKTFYAISPGGKVRWSAQIYPKSVPAVAGETVFVGSGKDYLYALDLKTGAEKWRFGGEGMSFTAVSATDKYVYAVSTGGMIYVLDTATGYEEERFYLKTTTTIPPLLDGNNMIVSGADGVVYALALE